MIFSAVLAIAVLGWRVSRTHNSSLPPAVVSEMRPAPIHATNPAPPVPTIPKPAAHKKRKTKEPVQDTAPLAPESSRVQVEIQHHFNGARASVWFDDELVFDQDLRDADTRHPLLRAVEMNQVTSFKFAPGKHYLQVRVVSAANTYDQIETLETELVPGSKHVLRVNCDKKKMQVELQ